MITFTTALVLLVLGYVVYGAFVERVFGADASRKTPCYTMADGVDYTPMPTWKVYLIQFLNIAGTGPIFGAILGILYGPAAYLWIVFGCIFGGAVHDYLSGMISLRKNGASLPEVVGDELGAGIRLLMRVFSLILMVLVGTRRVVGFHDRRLGRMGFRFVLERGDFRVLRIGYLAAHRYPYRTHLPSFRRGLVVYGRRRVGRHFHPRRLDARDYIGFREPSSR